MPLWVGEKIGHYEVISLLGKGGMGEVWKARDTMLKRDVALKVLPATFLRDPERMARFQREAEVLASLDHPNIGPIYGIIDSEDSRGLVLALIEGPTLADRIEAGPIPLDEAVGIAKQIIEALEYAHDRGVIHRDLKPANVKITPEGVVKVLDFGLAKVLEDEPPPSSLANSPTLTLGHTRTGVILGTAAYMSPEQAVGRPVDRRSDIFSFGAVLYEMLTGKRAFAGATTPDVLEAVVKNDPDWTALPAGMPGYLRRLLERTLVKDRKQRLQAIGEARIVLEGGLEPPAPPISGRLFVFAWAAAALVLALALAALAFVHFRETTPEPGIARFQILPPEKLNFGGNVSVSPDDRRVAYVVRDAAGNRQLWVRAIDALDAQAVAENVSGDRPFWSPDSRFIAYPAQGKLQKSNLSGGPSFTICDATGPPYGGGWNRDGVILLGGGNGIRRVSADGGIPSPVTALDAKRFESAHVYPSFLPDGRHFIFLRASSRPEFSGIYLGSLDDKPEAPGRRLVATESMGTFVSSEQPGIGFLLFLRDTTLMAQRFDYRRLEMIGEARPIVQTVEILSPTLASFSASTRVLAYRASMDTTQLTWYGRDGKMLDTAGEPGHYTDLTLAPDGTRVAFDRNDPGTSKGDLWVFDISRHVSTRLTFHPGLDSHPVWSPDSERIAFRSVRDGSGDLYQKAANGAGQEEVLLKSNEDKFPFDWSSDGRLLLYSLNLPQTSSFVLPLTGDRRPVTYLANQFSNGQGAFSPDNRWVAYRSNETGANEVYVQSFPANSDRSGKWRVSTGGGLEPRWRKDGKELFYLSGRELMAVDITTLPTFKPGVPHVLFEAPIRAGNSTISRHYAVTADGQKFLINASREAQGSAITVVMNWATALKK